MECRSIFIEIRSLRILSDGHTRIRSVAVYRFGSESDTGVPNVGPQPQFRSDLIVGLSLLRSSNFFDCV
jgi:hypothetical protein